MDSRRLEGIGVVKSSDCSVEWGVSHAGWALRHTFTRVVGLGVFLKMVASEGSAGSRVMYSRLEVVQLMVVAESR